MVGVKNFSFTRVRGGRAEINDFVSVEKIKFQHGALAILAASVSSLKEVVMNIGLVEGGEGDEMEPELPEMRRVESCSSDIEERSRPRGEGEESEVRAWQ